MAEPPIRFRCSACHKRIAANANLACRKIKCPTCGQVLTVPKPVLESPTGGQPSPESPQDTTADKPAAPPAAPFWTPPVVVTLSTIALLAIVGLVFGNLATRIVVVLVVLTALNGLWMGASHVAAAMGGMLIAVLLAVPLGRWFEGLSGAVFGLSGLGNRMVSTALWAAIVTALVATGLSIPIRRLMKKRSAWQRHDRLVGVGLGVLEGGILGMLVLWVALTVEPLAAHDLAQAARPGGEVAASSSSSSVAAVAQATRQSFIGRIADALNPLREVRLFSLFGDAQAVLADPVALERFRSDPAIERLRHRPSVRRALELLSADPPIVDMDDGLDDHEIRALLASPRFLAMLDETNLLDELTPIAAELQQALQAARQTGGSPH